MNDRGKGVQMATDIVWAPDMFLILISPKLNFFVYFSILVSSNKSNRCDDEQAETGTLLAKHALSSVAQSKPTRSSRVSTSTPHSLVLTYTRRMQKATKKFRGSRLLPGMFPSTYNYCQ